MKKAAVIFFFLVCSAASFAQQIIRDSIKSVYWNYIGGSDMEFVVFMKDDSVVMFYVPEYPDGNIKEVEGVVIHQSPDKVFKGFLKSYKGSKDQYKKEMFEWFHFANSQICNSRVKLPLNRVKEAIYIHQSLYNERSVFYKLY